MSVDLQLCRKILDDGSMEPLLEAGIDGKMLFDEGRKVHAFIKDYRSKYGNMPPISTVETETGAALPAAPDLIQFYIDKVLERTTANRVGEAMKKAQEKLKVGDADDALRVLQESVLRLQPGQKTPKKVENLSETTAERFVDYIERAQNVGIDGIVTPWPLLTKETQGWHPGEFWIVVARKKTGKTWALVLMTEVAWRAGERPLLVSMEMPKQKIRKRFDAMHSKLPARDFKDGTLGVFGEQKYLDVLKDMTGKHPVWVAGDGMVRTVADVELLIDELKPTLVLIDGVYMMFPASGMPKSKYDRVSMVADELQSLFLRKKVAGIASTQFNRQLKSGTLKGQSEQIGFAYELALNCDGMIGLFGNEETKRKKEMVLTLMEHREGEELEILVNWDLNTMDFTEIGAVNVWKLEENPADSKGAVTSPEEIDF